MDKLVFTALNTLSSQRFERQSITNELANLSTVSIAAFSPGSLK
jgi:flagellar basal body rod protein FlgF